MSLEAAKRIAARKAVDDYIKDGHAVGVGSGSTIVHAIHRIAERVRDEGLRLRCCVPTSFQSKILCGELGLPLSDCEWRKRRVGSA
jgi:ribose 5-phosphate isomerase A